MRLADLVRRSLIHYWRTNLAVVAGVATAVSVLAGALLVGESVRGSLRNLVVERLGNTSSLIAAGGYFREELAEAFADACPIIWLEGLVVHQESGRRATGVQVYGIDERFWRFHGRENTIPGRRDLLLSPSLASELAAGEGDGILLRIEKPSYIPAESLHGRKADAARTVRFTVREVVPARELGEFSVEPRQGAVRAAFVSLATLQRELEQTARVNTILVGASRPAPEQTLNESFQLADLGLRVRSVDQGAVVQLESEGGFLSDGIAEQGRAAASAVGAQASGVLTYLANTLRVGSREVPYSLVAAVTGESGLPAPAPNQIIVNDWAARDLGARSGQTLTMEYYLWQPDGRLQTETAEFTVAGVTLTRDQRGLAPEYPGITDSEDVTDWDPPFPMDLGRISKRDEEYWDRYQATPKGFIRLEAGQRLWESRYGRLTALRIPGADADAYRQQLRQRIDPFAAGFTVFPVREQGLEASEGATDFGEYFVYFSFFLVVSALMLAGLFFRLGLEQRVRETGLLEAVGYPAATVRRLFALEGGALALAGGVIGMAGATAYAWVIVYGLRTWWVDAVGTEMLEVHVSPVWLVTGAAGACVAALASVFWTLRGLRQVTPKDRLAGVVMPTLERRPTARRSAWTCAVAAACGLLLVVAGATGLLPQVAGFFGAGALLLIALLAGFRARLARQGTPITGNGAAAVARLGGRNCSYRPGRAVLSVALIASATFILVAVDAFRLAGAPDVADPKSGSGGYPLMAESLLPLYYNPETAAGREALGIEDIESSEFVSFRLRPGDDVSCLNLYQPRNPRVLGVPDSLIDSGRFSFQSSVAETPEEEANPWLLLRRPEADGAIPAAAAANSLTYVLHKKLGEEFILELASGRSVRFRIVAALADTVFQRELIISEEQFRSTFPDEEGYRVFLLNAPEASGAQLEERLSDYGFDVTPAAAQIAEFHRVENTYLSTFQTLGALGLLLGTVGLSVVLLRNVLERRRELGLLRAVGYDSRHMALLVLAENLYLLVSGLAIGVVTALIAILPAFTERGGSLSAASLIWLLAPVLVAGILTSIVATAATLRSPLLASLRAE